MVLLQLLLFCWKGCLENILFLMQEALNMGLPIAHLWLSEPMSCHALLCRLPPEPRSRFKMALVLHTLYMAPCKKATLSLHFPQFSARGLYAVIPFLSPFVGYRSRARAKGYKLNDSAVRLPVPNCSRYTPPAAGGEHGGGIINVN